VHSFLSQAECAGEIISGVALAALAQASGITGVLIASAAIVALTGALVFGTRTARTPVSAS
jgi:hypothetical protein